MHLQRGFYRVPTGLTSSSSVYTYVHRWPFQSRLIASFRFPRTYYRAPPRLPRRGCPFRSFRSKLQFAARAVIIRITGLLCHARERKFVTKIIPTKILHVLGHFFFFISFSVKALHIFLTGGACFFLKSSTIRSSIAILKKKKGTTVKVTYTAFTYTHHFFSQYEMLFCIFSCNSFVAFYFVFKRYRVIGSVLLKNDEKLREKLKDIVIQLFDKKKKRTVKVR